MTAFHALVIYRDSLPHGSIYSSVITALLSNAEQIRTMTIEQAAELCFTSTATLSRLARALGYLGYSDFRSSLDYACRNYYFENRVMPRVPDHTFHPGDEYLDLLAHFVEQYHRDVDLELFRNVADAMQESDDINLFLNEIQDFAAVQLQVDLTVGGKTCLRCASLSDQLARARELTERSFVVLLYNKITPLPSGNHTPSELLDILREKGARLLVLAPKKVPIALSNRDFLLEYEASGTSLDNYLQQISLSLLTLAYRTRFLEHAN